MDGMKDIGAKSGDFRRRVFYIPGYDPFHPRRYRELYRKEGAAQAAVSGYAIDLKPKRTGGPYGWRVLTKIDGAQATADIEVLVWSDIVKASMTGGIAATYGQLVRTAWVYVGSGALFRLMRAAELEFDGQRTVSGTTFIRRGSQQVRVFRRAERGPAQRPRRCPAQTGGCRGRGFRFNPTRPRPARPAARSEG